MAENIIVLEITREEVIVGREWHDLGWHWILVPGCSCCGRGDRMIQKHLSYYLPIKETRYIIPRITANWNFTP